MFGVLDIGRSFGNIKSYRSIDQSVRDVLLLFYIKMDQGEKKHPMGVFSPLKGSEASLVN
jgi:hypothetical protein